MNHKSSTTYINIIALDYITSVKDRLIGYLEYKGMTKSEFGRRIGVSSAFITSMRKSMQPDKIRAIKDKFPDLNTEWLLTGEGEMLNTPVESPKAEQEFKPYFKEPANILVPLINVDSVGGMEGHNIEVADGQFVEALIPFPDARPDDWAIHQSDESMAPAIPAGAILQIRQVIDWQEYFGYGNVYVLWLTDDRRITKLVKKYEPDPKNYVLCCSYNFDYADEELPRKMIKQVWKVVNVLINKGW